MTLDAHEYGDPMLVLQRKQQHAINRAASMERVCAGCIHRRTLTVGTEVIKSCELRRGNPTIYCNYKQTWTAK